MNRALHDPFEFLETLNEHLKTKPVKRAKIKDFFYSLYSL
ncbi:MAG: hypothetical protein RIT03_1097 [Bacteroidota bacterium]|jgi:hypothetical protein